VKNEGLNYIVAAFDLAVNQEIKSLRNIQRYPTFRLYINGAEIQY
jgi:hypothetical protein